ncbi:MAG: hypothetical protein PHP54_04370 [Clostridia bacterium]|nr:hypothetical protein [Clostridia bacterium]
MKKNMFLTFCFSFIPGAGQMYQGYMKRGLSLMIMIGLAIALTSIVSMPLFAIPIPLIFAYSFFDTYNIRNRIGTNAEQQDKLIWESTSVEDAFNKLNIKKRSVVLGVILIAIGVYLLINSVIRQIAFGYDIEWLYRAIVTIMNYLPPILIAAACIWAGSKFISKK